LPDGAGRNAQGSEQIERDPKERPRLVLVSFKDPDGVGHFAAMESEAT
jgi:hypothetical protein